MRTYNINLPRLPVLDEEPPKYEISYDLNGNEITDQIMVNNWGVFLYVDGDFICDFYRSFEREEHFPLILEIGDFDNEPGDDVRIFSDDKSIVTYTQEPISPRFTDVWSHQALLEKWKERLAYLKDFRNFETLKILAEKEYSPETLQQIVKWVRDYQGENCLTALEICRSHLERALTDNSLEDVLQIEIISCFHTAGGWDEHGQHLVGKIPPWSFAPILDRYDQAESGSYLSITCAFAMAGARYPKDFHQIARRMRRLPPGCHENFKGLSASLAMTGKSEAKDILLKLWWDPSRNSFLTDAQFLLVTALHDKNSFWKLQIHYSELMANKEEGHPYLPSDFNERTYLKPYKPEDLQAVQTIVDNLHQWLRRRGSSQIEIIQQSDADLVRWWEAFRNEIQLSLP